MLVNYFKEKGIRIKKVVLGENHSVALSTDGQVYTWGQGKRSSSMIFGWLFPSKFFWPATSALGHDSQNTIFRPRKVASLANQRIVDISAGKGYSLALDSEGRMWGWGSAQYGVLGSGENSQKKYPTLNKSYEHLKELDSDHQFESIQSTHYTSLAKTSTQYLLRKRRNIRLGKQR